uniref:V-type proton ATPase subunit d 1 isoform X2 n=1 Tax=Callorhinus ursinus TaxID=34884 RepID=A0A3Q7RVA5_CALUR|nr:V-type proton ATPase subunit d 1 isoform X2 [Callorhinus ursinus]
MSFFPELYFNVDNGYLEGLVRGLKAGVLSQADYLNLVQCETLEDLKLHLQSTDYGNFLANEASPLTVSVIDDRLKEKMVVEFRHMRNHAYEPLASFLDFITYSYMIDNVILLITGTLHQRSIAELVPKCHPLGSFEQMEAVNIAQTPAELYNAILVDTPLAAFFQDCISEQDLDEMNIEIIRNTLYKQIQFVRAGCARSHHSPWAQPLHCRADVCASNNHPSAGAGLTICLPLHDAWELPEGWKEFCEVGCQQGPGHPGWAVSVNSQESPSFPKPINLWFAEAEEGRFGRKAGRTAGGRPSPL